MLDPFDYEYSLGLIADRSNIELAAQIVYQCRVLSILRSDPARAPDLLRDPTILAAEYRRRFTRDEHAPGTP